VASLRLPVSQVFWSFTCFFGVFIEEHVSFYTKKEAHESVFIFSINGITIELIVQDSIDFLDEFFIDFGGVIKEDDFA
jgi:hypothetical protein